MQNGGPKYKSLDCHNWYSGVFGFADYESELKIRNQRSQQPPNTKFHPNQVTFRILDCHIGSAIFTIYPYISTQILREWQHYYSEYQGVAVYVPLSVFVTSTLLLH